MTPRERAQLRAIQQQALALAASVAAFLEGDAPAPPPVPAEAGCPKCGNTELERLGTMGGGPEEYSCNACGSILRLEREEEEVQP